MYWIRISKDFKRLFNYEKVLWYSIDSLQFKKVLWYSIKTLCHFKKVLMYSIKTFHHLKKSHGIQNHSNFDGLFNKLDSGGFCGIF